MKNEVTIERALWWNKAMLLREMEKSGWSGGMCGEAILEAMNRLETMYCEDAPALAMTSFLKEKQCDIRGPFTVYMKVKTKQGKGYIFNVSIGEINFATKDMVDFQRELVRPTSFKLVRQAAKELKFEDVLSVTAYVDEVNPVVKACEEAIALTREANKVLDKRLEEKDDRKKEADTDYDYEDDPELPF